MACGWHLVSKYEIEQQGEQLTWLGTADEVAQISPGDKYYISLYFIVVTLSTLGYGDISPKTI